MGSDPLEILLTIAVIGAVVSLPLASWEAGRKGKRGVAKIGYAIVGTILMLFPLSIFAVSFKFGSGWAYLYTAVAIAALWRCSSKRDDAG